MTKEEFNYDLPPDYEFNPETLTVIHLPSRSIYTYNPERKSIIVTTFIREIPSTMGEIPIAIIRFFLCRDL